MQSFCVMTPQDTDCLREEGWTDRDILDITQICAYFNYRDRMANAQGVEIDDITIERAREGAARAAEQARLQGDTLPEDPWGVRNVGGGSLAERKIADLIYRHGLSRPKGVARIRR